MTAWIVETLVATSLLMMIVLLLRGPVAQRFGPRAAYALWLLPALRMVAPPLPAGLVETPMTTLAPAHYVVTEVVSLAMPQTAPATVVEAAAPLPWGAILLAVWLGGAALFLLWHLVAYRRFMARVLSGAEQLPMLDREGIEVCASRAVPGPFAAGIFVKKVVLPADWRRRYAADELRLAMAHEAAHHQRADLSANLVALVLVALHWFNPIAHWAHRAFRADQELACDALVLRGAGSDDRHAYGSALVKSAIGRRPVALAPLRSGDDLKRRLRMMKNGAGWTRGGTALAVVLTAAGLALTASGGVAAETGRQVAEETVAAVQQVAVPPSVPDAPEPPEAVEPPAAPDAPDPPAPPRTRDFRGRTITVSNDGTTITRRWEELSPAEQREIERSVEAAERAGEAARRAGLEAAAEGRIAARQAAEAAREAAIAGREAEQAGREAERMARRQAIEASRIAHQGQRIAILQRRDCERSQVQQINAGGHRMNVKVCGTGIDEAEMRAIRLSALESARVSILSMRETLPAEAQREALAEVNQAIAELRDER